MIPYSKQSISMVDTLRVARQLKFKTLTQGDQIERFEESIAKYVGANFAVAVSSATAGLHLSHLALEAPGGSKVVTSPISFVASSNSILYAGHKPIFVDIDPNTGNIDIDRLKEVVKQMDIHTVVPVHYSGFPCNMEEIYALCKKNSIKIVEDAAHALGGSYLSGKKIGSCEYADLTVFSFHPVKSITTGEGGVITTNQEDLYNKLIKLRSHGIEKNEKLISNSTFAYTNGQKNLWYYEMDSLGYHYRLTEIQATLGISQLKKINKFIAKRRRVAAYYDKSFKGDDRLTPLQVSDKNISAHHLYPVKIHFDRIKLSRNELMIKLRKHGIMTQVHYIPIPLQPYYRSLGYSIENLPNAMKFYFEILSIPIYPKMSLLKQKKVVKILKILVQ